jgi:hypothetical protein
VPCLGVSVTRGNYTGKELDLDSLFKFLEQGSNLFDSVKFTRNNNLCFMVMRQIYKLGGTYQDEASWPRVTKTSGQDGGKGTPPMMPSGAVELPPRDNT